MAAEQGDLLKVNGISFPIIFIINNFFNSSGKAIVCPIVRNVSEGPLHIRLKDSPVEGIVLCEQVRYLDLASRSYSRLGALQFFETINISDAVMGMFDYQTL